MVLSRVCLCKCLTEPKDNWCTDTVYFMFGVWVYTLIRMEPANIAQTCCTTPKLTAKPNGLSWIYLQPWRPRWTMDSSKLNYVSFGTNFIHLSLNLLMRGRNLENLSIGSKFALSATCKLENIVPKRPRLMASLTSTYSASVLCSQNIRLLGGET